MSRVDSMSAGSRGFRAKVLLLISNLEYGGAQRQVVELANRLNAEGTETFVCTLSDHVPLACKLDNQSRVLHVIQKRCKFDISVVGRLRRLVEGLNVDIIHAFLLDAEIAGRLAGRRLHGVAMMGSERNADHEYKWRHTAALRLTARWFDAIIANSNAGRRFQIRTLSIASDKVFVVHNGVDVVRFAPRPKGDLGEPLGIPADAPVVAMFCSFKRQKNHAMFFRMAKRVLESRPEAMFLCVGGRLHGGLQGTDTYHRQMLNLVEALGLSGRVLFLGNRDNIVDLYNLCDATVLTSKREGTPNVLLESMACGVPVVTTDVADNALIVPDGHAGYVVPYDDDAAMADRVLHILSDEGARRLMGSAARKWVAREFSMASLVQKTLAVYDEVLQRKRAEARV